MSVAQERLKTMANIWEKVQTTKGPERERLMNEFWDLASEGVKYLFQDESVEECSNDDVIFI